MEDIESSTLDPACIAGVKYLKRIFGLLERLAPAGCERDKAGNRQFFYSHYAGLVLLGLFNPTLQSAQGLVEASKLRKVQRALGGGRVSAGSFAESVRVFDPALLAGLFEELLATVPAAGNRPATGGLSESLVRRLVAVDGTALRTLPQMVAHGGPGGQWRLHLQLEVCRDRPQQATLTEDEVGGAADERSVLGRTLQAGRVYVLDRGYERYALFEKIVAARSDYLCRVQRRPLDVLQSRPLSDEARAAGVTSDDLVRLGRSRGDVGDVTHAVRRVVIAGPPQGRPRRDRAASDEVVLLTSLLDAPAEIIALLYRQRWLIEIFFRFLKHVLGCHHLISQKPQGIAIQVYCALIAALLLSGATGGHLGRRGFELVCLYFQGWADEDELVAGLERLARAKTSR